MPVVPFRITIFKSVSISTGFTSALLIKQIGAEPNVSKVTLIGCDSSLFLFRNDICADILLASSLNPVIVNKSVELHCLSLIYDYRTHPCSVHLSL